MNPQIKQCAKHGKKGYTTQRMAIKYALRYSKMRATPLRVYRDNSCGCWHLTSKPRTERGAA